MSEITHRVLRLLGLLESRSTWTGSELAERLGVTQRTVRRDVIRVWTVDTACRVVAPCRRWCSTTTRPSP